MLKTLSTIEILSQNLTFIIGKLNLTLYLIICRELEEENASLQAEYERLRSKSTPESTPEELRTGDNDMAAEARLLRQHKGRLEARMQILEDHNRQLEAQLQRLRQLLDEVSSELKMKEIFYEDIL